MPVSKASSQTGSRAEAEERRLVQAAQKDSARFADLYEKHFDAIYAFVARRVRDRHITEDLTADVFHKALAALPRFDWRGVPFGVWLFRIASNVVVDHWKQSARESSEEPPEPATEADFEDALQRGRLFRMVADLPADQRRVVQMRFAEGHSVREIGAALKKTDGAIKQLQFRALQTLRKRMNEPQSGKRHG
jgi:RNA polymerase sigma-70 factor (ECF subfamily)